MEEGYRPTAGDRLQLSPTSISWLDPLVQKPKRFEFHFPSTTCPIPSIRVASLYQVRFLETLTETETLGAL